METKWCLDVLKQGIEKYGKPEIVNSDHGSQYTSAMWTQFLEKQQIKISMDGKGRATDNTWIERFWRSIKTDYIYLNPCNDGLKLVPEVQHHITYYNNKTHHTTKQKPKGRYNENLLKKVA